MAENSTAGLIQHEVAQGLVLGDELALLPKCLARWRCHAANDDIPDLTLGVAGYDMDDLAAAHAPRDRPCGARKAKLLAHSSKSTGAALDATATSMPLFKRLIRLPYVCILCVDKRIINSRFCLPSTART